MSNLKWAYFWLGIQLAAVIAFLFFAGPWRLTSWQGIVLVALITASGQSAKYWERHLAPSGATK